LKSNFTDLFSELLRHIPAKQKCDSVGKRQSYKLFNINAYRFSSIKYVQANQVTAHDVKSVTKKAAYCPKRS